MSPGSTTWREASKVASGALPASRAAPDAFDDLGAFDDDAALGAVGEDGERVLDP